MHSSFGCIYALPGDALRSFRGEPRPLLYSPPRTFHDRRPIFSPPSSPLRAPWSSSVTELKQISVDFAPLNY